MRSKLFFQKLIRLNVIIFFSSFLLISFAISTITLFFPKTSGDVNSNIVLDSIFEKIFFGIILVPLIETLIFQSLIISVICKLIKRARSNFYPAIVFSAFAFSLNHSYNAYYMIYTFIVGTILAFAYYIARYRKESAVLLVFAIHATYNFTSFLLDAI